jgi:hypothetical protein
MLQQFEPQVRNSRAEPLFTSRCSGAKGITGKVNVIG